METQLFYDIQMQHGIIWDWRVAADLFFGGVGVGAFLFALALSRYADRRYLPLARTAAVIAPLAVIVGLSLLFWKLGYKSHVYQMGLNLSNGSVMWWGAFIQGLFVAIAIVFAILLISPDKGLGRLIPGFIGARFVGWAGAPVASAVGIYHGLLLSVLTSHPLWASGSMVMASVLLFIITGIGAALFLHGLIKMLAGYSDEEGDPATYATGLKSTGYVLIAAIAFMLLNLGAWWLDLYYGSATSRAALEAALANYGTLLAVVGIALGLVLPLLLALFAVNRAAEPRPGTSPFLAFTLAGILLLAGGFAIRYSAVFGGQETPPVATFATLSKV
jgi:protein NrfD